MGETEPGKVPCRKYNIEKYLIVLLIRSLVVFLDLYVLILQPGLYLYFVLLFLLSRVDRGHCVDCKSFVFVSALLLPLVVVVSRMSGPVSMYVFSRNCRDFLFFPCVILVLFRFQWLARLYVDVVPFFNG